MGDFDLTPADVSLFTVFTALQADATAAAPTAATLQDLVVQLNSLVYGPAPTNRVLGLMVSECLHMLAWATTPSMGGYPLPAMLITWQWGQYNTAQRLNGGSYNGPQSTTSFWNVFAQQAGAPSNQDWATVYRQHLASLPVLIPEAALVLTPPGRFNSSTPGESVPNLIWDLGWDTRLATWPGPVDWTPACDAVAKYEEGWFAPENWTDSSGLVSAFEPAYGIEYGVWSSGPPIDASAALFLLFSAIAGGDEFPSAPTLTAATTSPEYPSDTVANQLVYLALMTLNDPEGNFVWSNPQLVTFLGALAYTFPISNAGPKLLQASIQNQMKILTADEGYPAQDPYAAVYRSFAQRQGDTLAALNAALGGS